MNTNWITRDVIAGAPFGGPLLHGMSFIVFGTRPCFSGTVDLAAGEPAEVLLVNGTAGDRARVSVAGGAEIRAELLLPPAGGVGIPDVLAVHVSCGQQHRQFLQPMGEVRYLAEVGDEMIGPTSHFRAVNHYRARA